MKTRSLRLSLGSSRSGRDRLCVSQPSQQATHRAEPQSYSTPPTAISTFPADLFPLSESCETCEACDALSGPCFSPIRETGMTNGLGHIPASYASAYRTRRRESSSLSSSRSSSNGSLSYQRHPAILPTRHSGQACRMRFGLDDVDNDGPTMNHFKSTNVYSFTDSSIESSPATTPLGESANVPRSMSTGVIGSLSSAMGSNLDLSAMCSSDEPTPPISANGEAFDSGFFR